LDADRRRGFADVDDALFDTTQIPLTSRDIRTVGELLHDVDHTARHLLMDVAGDDAGRLLRGWPDLVTAAASLWSSLPGQGFGAGAHTRDEPITRLVSVGDAIGRSLRSSSWPPASRPDRRMTRMTRTLGHAGDLVLRYGADIPVQRTESFRDLEAARARIMHALYVSAHAVGVSLHQHGRSRYQAALGTNRPIELNHRHSPYAVPPTTEWIRRMAVSEAAAGRYLDGRFTQALRGEANRPIEDNTRISQALARWDIQAHRTLASDVWPTNMVLITRTQGLIAGAAMVLVDAAQHAGHLEPNDRLSPAIAEAGRAWSNLASRWGDLTAPDARLDPDLMHTAAEVRAAYRELTHASTTMASLDVIATRPGLSRGSLATLHALECGSELAYVVAEKATARGLIGPARALSLRAHNDIEAGLASPHPEGDIVWIAPADILARKIVRAPHPVVEGLQNASLATVESCNRASAVSLAHSGAREAGCSSEAHALLEGTEQGNVRWRQAQNYSPAR
jgi:hypothetical protein